ncbi:MAG: hypothetical protein IID49_10875, partial [Proteobacteria bacterium]|nr:hypothetical protein [Pseudomonadota bacterium]
MPTEPQPTTVFGPGPAAPDAWLFLCGIGGDGDPGSLAEAAGRLEADARPVAGGAISVATASVRLDPARHLDAARRCLSGAETERAGRFVKHADQVRYTLAHAMLRT